MAEKFFVEFKDISVSLGNGVIHPVKLVLKNCNAILM